MANFWVVGGSRLGHVSQRTKHILSGYSGIPYEDIMIHLGNVCATDDTYWNDKVLRSSSCRKWLVLGQHDNCDVSWYLDMGWDAVVTEFRLSMFGYDVWFSNLPRFGVDEISSVVNVYGYDMKSNLLGLSNILYTPERFIYKPVELETLIGDLKNE